MTEDTTMLAATRYHAAERLPPIVRAVLDARDEAAVGFGARGAALAGGGRGGAVGVRLPVAVPGGLPGAGGSARRGLGGAALVAVPPTAARARGARPPAPPAAGRTGTTAAWTLKLTGDVRWQQVTPAGALLVSTDAALAGGDIDRGQVMWEKADLGGVAPHHDRLGEWALLREAVRPRRFVD